MMSQRPHSELISTGELFLDTANREMWRQGDGEVHLTRTECCLLGVLMAHPGEIISHKTLMHEVWNTTYVGDVRILYVHIHALRRKMEGIGGVIDTVRGVGYRFRTWRWFPRE